MSAVHPHVPTSGKHTGDVPVHWPAFVDEHCVHAPAIVLGGFWQTGRAGRLHAGCVPPLSFSHGTQTWLKHTGFVPPQCVSSLHSTHVFVSGLQTGFDVPAH